jgi:Uma2 family endonuclease
MLPAKRAQPGLAYFSKERRKVLTDKGAEGAPDLVVEILSPSTAKAWTEPCGPTRSEKRSVKAPFTPQ